MKEISVKFWCQKEKKNGSCSNTAFVCLSSQGLAGVNTLILDLQSISRESNNKDVAAMLVELTREANEESFVIVHQHGGNDVTCKSRIQKYQPAICQFVLVAT